MGSVDVFSSFYFGVFFPGWSMRVGNLFYSGCSLLKGKDAVR